MKIFIWITFGEEYGSQRRIVFSDTYEQAIKKLKENNLSQHDFDKELSEELTQELQTKGIGQFIEDYSQKPDFDTLLFIK